MNEQQERKLAKLAALESGGVDNWEFYDDALEEWNKENELLESLDDAVGAIEDVLLLCEVDYPAGREAGPQVNLSEEQVYQIKEIIRKLLVK